MNTMENKRIRLYLLVLLLLCLATTITFSFLFSVRIHEGDLPIPVMVLFTIPAFFCIISLLSTNGFRNFRLDALGIVSSGILVIVFVGLMGFLYFFPGDALRYPFYSREYTAVVLAVCSFIGILPLIALHDTYKKNAKVIKEQGKTPGRIWRNLQYGTFVAATLLVVFTLLPATKEGGYVLMFAEYNEYNSSFSGLFALFAFLSLSLGAVFLLSNWLWNQAKIASVLSVLLFVPPIGIASYFYLSDSIGYYEGSQLDYRYTRMNQSDSSPDTNPEGVYVYDENNSDYGTESEHDGENYDEQNTYNPEFIGDGIIGTSSSDPDTGDIDSIYAAITYFGKNMSLNESYIQIPLYMPEGLLPYLDRSSGSENIGGYGSLAYDGLIKMLWENRKSMVIKGVFGLYSNAVERALPYETYRDNGYEKLVNQLITAYHDMDGNTETFRKIYTLMDPKIYQEKTLYDAYDEYFKLIDPYVSPGAEESFRPEEREEGESDEAYSYKVSEAHQRLVWVYSFWGRRSNEGIAENVYDALVALRAFYGV